MSDYGHRYADKKLSVIDRELRSTYRKARKELQGKLTDFNAHFAKQDAKKQQQVAAGELSGQEYKDWLARQVFRRGIWEQKLQQVEQVMLHHNQYAMDIVNNSRFDVFAENYYSEAFKANWIMQGVDFSIYNTQAMQRLIEDDPKLLPEWKIDEPKDYVWNQQRVNNILRQGIIQGEGVEQITKRLCDGLSTQNENRMRMFARTAITGAQNAGRQVQMNQAADMGIEVNKRWIAVMDSRTRDSHRAMDGVEVPYDEDFPNGLEYPGDPNGDPAETYNCRCTMQTVYPKYEDRSKQWREGVTIDGVPYEEWKEGASGKVTDSFKGMGSGNASSIKSGAGKLSIQPIDFGRNEKRLSTKAIVEKIAKFDPNGGSCSSAAFAYIANKFGYDVQDFRGGESENYFGWDSVIKQIGSLDGVKSRFVYGNDDFTAAHKLMSKMEVGKEYYLAVGGHSSIVKRTDTAYRYLELQGQSVSDGYHMLNDKVLEWRFGCEKNLRDEKGNPRIVQSTLIDIETLKGNKDFLDVMRYINTKPGKR